MIRVGPPPSSSGFRTRLNEFHSQVYVNVDPPQPPPEGGALLGSAPALTAQTLISGTTIFVSETEIKVGQSISGFHINFGPWNTPFDALPFTFLSNYSGKVEQLQGRDLVVRSLAGSPLETFFLRWNQASVKVYFSTISPASGYYIVTPRAESLVKPSSTAGKFILTGLMGQSCTDLYLSREEESSSQKFRLKYSVFTENSVNSVASLDFDLLGSNKPFKLDFAERSIYAFYLVY